MEASLGIHPSVNFSGVNNRLLTRGSFGRSKIRTRKTESEPRSGFSKISFTKLYVTHEFSRHPDFLGYLSGQTHIRFFASA